MLQQKQAGLNTPPGSVRPDQHRACWHTPLPSTICTRKLGHSVAAEVRATASGLRHSGGVAVLHENKVNLTPEIHGCCTKHIHVYVMLVCVQVWFSMQLQHK